MKTQQLLIPMLLLSACRTTAGTKDKPNAAKPYAAQSEALLEKAIGRLDLDGKKDQIYVCVLTSNDVVNAEETKKLIAQVPRGDIKNIAYHFRAQEPSLEIYAIEKGNKIPLKIDHQTLAERDDAASKTLIEEINKKCPGPKAP